MTDTNRNENESERMSSEFERGYRVGYRGDELPADASNAYYEGWDVGNSDRPSMEERSLDVEKERRDPLGF